MIISKIIVFVSLCVFITESYKEINMEPEELQSSTIHPTALSRCKKSSIYLVQLIGVTISLVSASVIANKIESMMTQNTYSSINEHKTSILSPSQICNNEFGCDRNICWRTCGYFIKVHVVLEILHHGAIPHRTRQLKIIIHVFIQFNVLRVGIV